MPFAETKTPLKMNTLLIPTFNTFSTLYFTKCYVFIYFFKIENELLQTAYRPKGPVA